MAVNAPASGRGKAPLKTKTILLLAAAVLVVILLIQNRQVVTYQLFFWKIAMSQVILVPFVFVIGFVTGLFLTKFERRKDKPHVINLPPQPPQIPGRS